MATYYVATTGDDDDDGSIGSPWATWQKAFLTATAGDTVYFRGGTWSPTSLYSGNNICLIRPKSSIGHTGLPGSPINYFNYPGETPVLDCDAVVSPGAFLTALQLEDVHFINWKGLTIKNLNQPVQDVEVGAIRGEAVSNMTWANIVIHDIDGHGWYMESDVGIEYIEYNIGWDGSGYIPYDTTTYTNCDTYNCCDYYRVNPGNEAYNMGDGFKHINGGANVTYTGCRAWNCCDDGFDMPGFGVTTLNKCWSFNNGSQDLPNTEGNGFKFGANDRDAPSPRRIITNCIAAYNLGEKSGVGFAELEYGEYYRCMSRIYNNLSYHNGIGYMISDGGTSFPDSESVYRNNIVYDTQFLDAGDRPDNFEVVCLYTESNNNWDYAEPGSLPHWDWASDITVSAGDFVNLTLSQLSGARKSDGSLPDITFGHLVAGSDCIAYGIKIENSLDGIDLIIDGEGKLYMDPPSIGPFEYMSYPYMKGKVNKISVV